MYMKFKSRIISLGIENRQVVARVVRMFVELNKGNFHYSWKGGGVIKHWRGFCGAENILYLDLVIKNK